MYRLNVILIGAIIALTELSFACDLTTCGTKNYVCASENSFYVCAAGKPIFDQLLTCPNDLNCNDDPDRCSAKPPTCKSKCSECDAKNNAACISKNEYLICMGNKPMESMKGSCGEKFCVTDNVEICSTTAPSCSAELKPTEPPTTVAPTTIQPSKEDITKRCKNSKKFGKFKTDDCRKYIYCRPTIGGDVIGQIYTCPEKTFFNCATQQCVKECNSSCETI